MNIAHRKSSRGKSSNSAAKADSREKPRHFLAISEASDFELRALIDLAHEMKRAGRNKLPAMVRPIEDHKVLALIFEKPSTRTRLSFDMAMRQLGGETPILNASDMQLGRGETIADTARVLSRFVDIIMIRANSHDDLLELAGHSSIPVINGLTNYSHPCQILADIETFEERKGPITGKTIAWVGDGNNVATSWLHAAEKFGFSIHADDT